jgi:sec-independent protein translocase protein TatB
VILGPERLPGAIRWSATALRQARDYLSSASNQLRDEIGPEFDDLRGPLSELQRLRGMTPRAALTKHLFDGDDSLFTAVRQLADEPGPDAASPDRTEAGQAPTPFDRDAT